MDKDQKIRKNPFEKLEERWNRLQQGDLSRSEKSQTQGEKDYNFMRFLTTFSFDMLVRLPIDLAVWSVSTVASAGMHKLREIIRRTEPKK